MKEIVALKDLMAFSLNTLLETELKWFEALDTLAGKAHSADLREMFNRSSGLAENHLRLLEEMLENLEQSRYPSKATVAAAIISEIQDVLELCADAEVSDAALLAGHQNMSHYKVARYGVLCAYAKLLGHKEMAETLHHILQEEKGGDEALTQLAELKINPGAKYPYLL